MRYHRGKILSETQIPKLCREVRSYIFDLVEREIGLSFTTDIWTASQTTKSYISLTLHYINKDFERKMFVLHCLQFEGSHTAVNIGGCFEEMLNGWEISRARCHLVISDNAANMVKTFSDLNINIVGCFARSLQLVIHSGLLSQRAVIDACAVPRSLVAYFKHSTSGCGHLRKSRQTLDCLYTNFNKMCQHGGIRHTPCWRD